MYQVEQEGYKVDKQAFLEDLFEALPKHEDPKIMNPCQMEKRLLKDKIRDTMQVCNLEKVTKDPSNVHTLHCKDKEESNDGGE